MCAWSEQPDPTEGGKPERKSRLVVLASGRGSNLQAILEACQSGWLPAQVVLVISDHPSAFALERARRAGVDTFYHPWKPFRQEGRSRADYDAALAEAVLPYRPDLIVLAGWMRLLTHIFLDRFPMQVINLHPALPGAFPGTDAIGRAWQAFQEGVIQETGVMVHFVPDEGVDSGPVIEVENVAIYPGETLPALEARIHQTEHRLLIRAIKNVLISRQK